MHSIFFNSGNTPDAHQNNVQLPALAANEETGLDLLSLISIGAAVGVLIVVLLACAAGCKGRQILSQSEEEQESLNGRSRSCC